MLPIYRNLLPAVANQLSRHQVTQKASLVTTNYLRDSENPLYKVGDWPRTKEDRERAAKKYNLIIEDYEPFPENEAMGDYPNLKAIGAYNRDWYDDFDDELEHKFYGEVWHRDDDLYFWERVDPLADEKPHQPMWQQALIFFGIWISMPIAYWIGNTYNLHPNHRYKMKQCNPEDTVFYKFPNHHP